MAIALALAKTLPTLTEMPPLVIDLSAYDSASIFYTNNMPENAHTSAYEKVLLSPYDFGTKCVLLVKIKPFIHHLKNSSN